MVDYVFNHDGFGPLYELADTAMTERDAVELLVEPVAASKLTAIDWCILTTAEHNCRTRHGRAFDGIGIGRDFDRRVGKVVAHYNAQPRDLLDIVVRHGHERGLKVFGNIRLNHTLHPERLAECPGVVNFCHYNSIKKDFRQWAFHRYLAELCEDLLARGVDGIGLDFERKAPFFPPEAPEVEKLEACAWFLRRVRELTAKPLIVRVAHEHAKGRAQGQDPLAWMREGLVDVVVPATHNHEPDPLDWPFADFLEAARRSPRPCRVWPQIWPTGAGWHDGDRQAAHPPEAVLRRTRQLVEAGADGVYFFNFCCYHRDGMLFTPALVEQFARLADGPASTTDPTSRAATAS